MDRGTLKILWECSRGERLRYAAAAVSLLLASLLAYLPPLVIKVTIDNALGGEPVENPAWLARFIEALGGVEGLRHQLWIAGAAIATVSLVAGLFTYFRGRWSAYASEQVTRRLRDYLYNHLHHLPASFHDKAETGDLVQRCTSDVEVIRLFLSTQLVELVRSIVMVLVALPIMLALSPSMTLAATVLLPVIVVFAIVFFMLVRGTFNAVEETEGALTTCLQENLTGIRVVRAFARQEFEYEKFSPRNEAHRAANMRLYWVLAWYWAVSDLLVFVQTALVLFVGAYYVNLGPAAGGITLGTLVAFLGFVIMYVWPVRQMGRILAELSKAVVSIKRIGLIVGTEEEEGACGLRLEACVQGIPLSSQVASPKPQAPLLGRIEFRDVHFSHGEVDVLRGVSFVVEPGQTLAILGPSGSGKSTVINLLLRFYDYASGSITLDGQELRGLPRKWVRSHFGVVMQEPFLYSRSLRENIALGSHTLEHAQLVEASTAAAVHETIQQFEGGYDTVIGERGITLSGGQRQRVALARALVRKPPVLLLDDAFSAVDTRTEASILHALRQRHGRQTTLVIAHRLTTLMHADRVVVLDGGRVVQSGTHDELIRVEGLYRRLWELQSEVAQAKDDRG